MTEGCEEVWGRELGGSGGRGGGSVVDGRRCGLTVMFFPPDRQPVPVPALRGAMAGTEAQGADAAAAAAGGGDGRRLSRAAVCSAVSQAVCLAGEEVWVTAVASGQEVGQVRAGTW